jgi:hypothetical protein
LRGEWRRERGDCAHKVNALRARAPGIGIIPSRGGLLHPLDFVNRLREASQGTSALVNFIEKGGASVRELVIFTGPVGLESRTIDSFDSGDEPETRSTNPVPPRLMTPSRDCSKKCSCAVVRGSIQAPFTTAVAPAVRMRRHSATRALDGLLGS